MNILNALVYSVIPFVVILVFLVVVHELGHFITAKMAGIKVLEFGIGYPPKIWGHRFGKKPAPNASPRRSLEERANTSLKYSSRATLEGPGEANEEEEDERTEYTINALPLGGFVRLLGEEDPSDPRSLAAKPRGIRILVLSAGALMNLLLPIVLFTADYMIPQQVPVQRVLIQHVAPDSPAQKAGLQAGDQILQIDGDKMQNIGDVAYAIQLHKGQTMTWEVKRVRDLKTIQVKGRWNPPTEIDPDTGKQVQQGATGIHLATPDTFTQTQSYPIWQAFPKAVGSTFDSLLLARNQVASWAIARVAPPVSGPVGIAQATGEVVKQAGWVALLQFAALLSINLAIINILPLPMLDGGKVLFVLVEILRGGKRVAPEKEALVHFVGFVLLLSLVVVISYFDIARIVHGGSLLR
ncbi:MAG: M50 family metallopeptidase [Dehalococcoidia bacterium]